MRKIVFWGMLGLALLSSCKRKLAEPRPTIPLVYSVAGDTTHVGRLAAEAGSRGADGSIAIIGEPLDAIALSGSFLSADRMDNIDGSEKRDSLPDFAGESFSVILDDYNAPYSHFVQPSAHAWQHLDSLREAAVRNALFAWDSTCVHNPAKLIIFTSSLQAEYGLFDVDTLQQLTGGKSIVLSSAKLMLEQAYRDGARNLAVWTSPQVAGAEVWQKLFSQYAWADAQLTVLSPEPALDVRTELRHLLRQYRSAGRTLDALLVDSYSAKPSLLNSELYLIRQGGTEEDAYFDKMISRDFRFLEPKSCVVQATYRILRSQSLFTHRIARPSVRYYETVESAQGLPVLEAVTASYVQNAYVQRFD